MLSIKRALFYSNCDKIKDKFFYIKTKFKMLIESITKLETFNRIIANCKKCAIFIEDLSKNLRIKRYNK